MLLILKESYCYKNKSDNSYSTAKQWSRKKIKYVYANLWVRRPISIIALRMHGINATHWLVRNVFFAQATGSFFTPIKEFDLHRLDVTACPLQKSFTQQIAKDRTV